MFPQAISKDLCNISANRSADLVHSRPFFRSLECASVYHFRRFGNSFSHPFPHSRHYFPHLSPQAWHVSGRNFRSSAVPAFIPATQRVPGGREATTGPTIRAVYLQIRPRGSQGCPRGGPGCTREPRVSQGRSVARGVPGVSWGV